MFIGSARWIRFGVGTISTLVWLSSAVPVATQEKKMPAQYAEFFQSLEGGFDMQLRVFPIGAPAFTSQGTVERAWIMNRAFLQSDSQTSVMGMQFRKRHLFGYDSEKGVPTMVTLDGETRQMLYAEGTISSDGRKISFRGPLPKKGRPALEVKTVFSIDGDNRHSLSEYWIDGDQYQLTMKINFTAKEE